jgi:predicted metalloprotease
MRTIGPLGVGGFLVLAVLSLLTGENFLPLPGADGTAPASDAGPVESSPAEEQMVQFVSFVLDDSQNTWSELLPGRYERARLVLFRDAIQSACGFAESATGPFYCPGDRKVYIDLGFYEELRQRFGAPGDFAQAYVLAHEIGHHVQTQLGIDASVRRERQRDPRLASQLSVRMELQADCFAGIWAHSTARRDILEKGDVEEGLNAAAAIGDDRLQRMATGRVSPERFTHGSSAQRVEWFRRGLNSGSVEACDTFAGGAR